MKDHDSVALICQETQLLRLRGAELESRATSVTQELRQAIVQRRALLERLRENHESLRQIVDESSRRNPQAEEEIDQRVSSR
jgi:hypothetical protein